MHKLDENKLITAALLRRFHAEADLEGGDGRYGAVIMRDNGTIITHALGPTASAIEVAFADALLRTINNELHHDGAWCIVFTHYVPPVIPSIEGRYSRLVLLWMDRDGDVQFPMEFDRGLEYAFNMGREAWLNQGESAWQTWKRMMRDVLDPTPAQLYHRAQGERAPSMVLH